MAKETITEYEPKEKSVTRIQCNSCETEWDDRSADDLNLVVLDCIIQQRRGNEYHSTWRNYDFTSNIYSEGFFRINGERTADLCDSCLSSDLDADPMLEVEKKDYYVEEKTREEYSCDLCSEPMGNEPDYDLSINPRIMIEADREYNVLVDDFNEPEYVNKSDRISVERDGVFDCCESCVAELFEVDAYGNTESVLSVLKNALFGI